MTKHMGILAAAASVMIASATFAPAQAAPAFAGSVSAIRDAIPEQTEEVRFRGGGFRHGGFRRHAFFRHHGHFRPWHHRRFVVFRPAYFGSGCFWKPARVVFTPYGERWVPARRVCSI
jgi:hypothetical protein